jgi:hypothetical protein
MTENFSNDNINNEANDNGREVRVDAAGLAAAEGIETMTTKEADAAVRKGTGGQRTVHDILAEGGTASSSLVNAYLQKFPEAEALLRAYEQAPTEEWISTQKANITRMIQPPTEDQLRSRPQIRAY